jgi:glutaredoxin 3
VITVYTTPTCAYCPMVKKYLTSKGVEFNTVDLEADTEQRKRLFELTGAMTVPITTDGTQYIIGWKPAELATLISF